MENTSQAVTKILMFQDHLHIRGEYSAEVTLTKSPAGSPPHTWRILMWWTVSAGVTRITSTYVENTVFLIKISRGD